MARFIYRLQKIYELRERKKKEQERRVQEAQARVVRIEQDIRAKKQEIRSLRQNMLAAPHTLLEAHDIFIHTLNEQLDELYQDLEMAKQQLEYERQLLIKAQAELETLIKHREKAYEVYLEEEKQLEMKVLNEVASQRYFRGQLEKAETEKRDAEIILENLEAEKRYQALSTATAQEE